MCLLCLHVESEHNRSTDRSAQNKKAPSSITWSFSCGQPLNMTQRCRPRNVSRSCRRTGYHHRGLANVLFWFQDHLLHIPRQDISSHVALVPRCQFHSIEQSSTTSY